MDKARAALIDLVKACDAALAPLEELRDTGRRLPRWTPRLRPDAFWFTRRLLAAADLALACGGPAHFQQLRRLCERPYDQAEERYRITEMIAAAAGCRLWALDRCGKAARAGGRKRKAPSSRPSPGGKGRKGAGQRPVRLRTIPVEPGRRLRGGREILEAMEGTYNLDRWRAFRREALKHDGPIEWGPRGTQPRAWENVLRLWLADRMEAAEQARQKRANQWKLELDKKTGKQAYTGGDDAPLRVVKHPGGRKGR